MNSLAAKVKKMISGTGALVPGDRVVMALSGGPDSLAMVHLLVGMRDELKIDLCIGHLNHCSRGDDSDEDERFVLALGESLGVKTFVDKIDVAEERSRFKTSFQETARILRRRFLESALEKFGGNKIALGHVADDQVETVLINLLRGSGLKGLGGMSAVSGRCVRPLLGCFKSEILQYLASKNLAFRVDKSNAKKDYLRNRIRLDLIPLLEKDYNPNFKQSILETANIIRDEDAYLSGLIDEFYPIVSLPCSEGEEGAKLSASKLSHYPFAIQKRLLRCAIFKIKGDLRRISSRHIQDVLKLLQSGISGKMISLPAGLAAVLRDGVLKIYKNPRPLSRVRSGDVYSTASAVLNIPGETGIAGSPVSFKAQLIPRADADYSAAVPNRAWLDFDKTGASILIRFFQPGDVFAPLGMSGAKKLKSFFIDAKVPREERRSIPILTTSANNIIWVYGKRISHKYRITEETRKVLLIEGFTTAI